MRLRTRVRDPASVPFFFFFCLPLFFFSHFFQNMVFFAQIKMLRYMYYMFVFGSARRAPTLPSVCGDKFEVHEVSSKVWARVHVPCVMCGDFFSRTNSPLGPNIACLQHWIYFVDVGVSPGKRYTSDFFASSSFFFLRSLVLFILSICLVTSFAPKVAYI